ncbi:GNAT family N-acetyltransferase [Streptomyces sp. TR06-5]|uniref:GNAT family N-acetyltransferase n=1 Tax=unclassified Streptomyces TaxID=2593676 RepID=UPI0039A090FC
MGTSVTIAAATDSDAEQILKLQYLCYQSEAAQYADWRIDPLTETLAQFRAHLTSGRVLVARREDEIVGSVRATVQSDAMACISRLFVHPRMRRHGLGGRLLIRIEECLAAEGVATRYRLNTDRRSDGNLRLYRRCGYATIGTRSDAGPRRVTLVTMEKTAPARQ